MKISFFQTKHNVLQLLFEKIKMVDYGSVSDVRAQECRVINAKSDYAGKLSRELLKARDFQNPITC